MTKLFRKTQNFDGLFLEVNGANRLCKVYWLIKENDSELGKTRALDKPGSVLDNSKSKKENN